MREPIAWHGPLPRHLAIIMDGNGRWARSRDQPHTEGHRRGAEVVRKVARTCARLGIEALTLYAFSAQNWRRPDEEVGALMQLLHDYLVGERQEIMDQRIRFQVIGQLDRLPSFVQKAVAALLAVTAENDGMTLSLALSYGGREEVVQATREIAAAVSAGELAPDAVDEALVQSYLWTQGLPSEVDLLIRTSGEQRLSNFLLWQCAYAELWFTDVLWPDFGDDDLFEALEAFGSRDRRFGGRGEST